MNYVNNYNSNMNSKILSKIIYIEEELKNARRKMYNVLDEIVQSQISVEVSINNLSQYRETGTLCYNSLTEKYYILDVFGRHSFFEFYAKQVQDISLEKNESVFLSVNLK